MKKISFLAFSLLAGMAVHAQMKVYSNGKIAFGSVSTTPNYIVDVISGDVNVNTLTNGYRLNGNMVLWQNNLSSALFVGNGAGTATTGTAFQLTGVGYNALHANTTGYNNVAVGYTSLATNTTGNNNTAIGNTAMNANTTGYFNAALGSAALYANTTGGFNVAVGTGAMIANTSGTSNTAAGYGALQTNTTSSNSTALGYIALYNSTGAGNTAVGYGSGLNTSTGINNTMLGYSAGADNTTGNYNTFVGHTAGTSVTTYTNSAGFGYSATPGGSNQIRIGNSNATVYCQSNVWSSDGRFKINVNEGVKGLDFIKKLRPVTYQFDTRKLEEHMLSGTPDSVKTEILKSMDFEKSTAIVHSGFIAQEVEQAAKAAGFSSSIVHTPDSDKDHYGIAYGEIVVPLVKAVQELSKTNDSLKAAINGQDSLLREMQQQLNSCCTMAGQTTNNTGNNSGQQTTGTTPVATNNSQGAQLFQNDPNPFNQTTVIKCYIPERSQSASLLIFDMNGTLKKTIPIGQKLQVSLTINGREFVAGMYLYSLIIDGNEIATKKMILTE
jgi:hypothetical protein